MDRGGLYEFLVAEQLSPTVIAAFDELSVSDWDGHGTLLRGTIRDQSHLHGVLARMQMLGLTLEGLRRLRGSSRGIGPLGREDSDLAADRDGGDVHGEQ